VILVTQINVDRDVVALFFGTDQHGHVGLAILVPIACRGRDDAFRRDILGHGDAACKNGQKNCRDKTLHGGSLSFETYGCRPF
jgi:hypothetical protein